MWSENHQLRTGPRCRPSAAVRLVCLFGLAVLVGCESGTESPRTESDTSFRTVPHGLDDPRGVYLHPGDEAAPAAVGRLTLQHLIGGAAHEVSRYHRFRSGDRFRFLVSANREGWLYVLHRYGDDPVNVLWPPSSGAIGDPGPGGANQMRPRIPKTVPPPPAVFKFDHEIGLEQFYVAIVSEPQPPELSVVTEPQASLPARPAAPPETSGRPPIRPESSVPPELQAAAEPDRPPAPGPRIVQFSVRSSTRGAPGPSRGVVHEPDPQSTDPATYFSLLPEDAGGALVFEFQLHHED